MRPLLAISANIVARTRKTLLMDQHTLATKKLLIGNSSFSIIASNERSFSSNKTSLPSQANVVVVGGGIIGTSVAYHLGKLGVENVLLLEQSKLTSGTTWHAAGLVNTFGSKIGRAHV